MNVEFIRTTCSSNRSTCPLDIRPLRVFCALILWRFQLFINVMTQSFWGFQKMRLWWLQVCPPHWVQVLWQRDPVRINFGCGSVYCLHSFNEKLVLNLYGSKLVSVTSNEWLILWIPRFGSKSWNILGAPGLLINLRESYQFPLIQCAARLHHFGHLWYRQKHGISSQSGEYIAQNLNLVYFSSEV